MLTYCESINCTLLYVLLAFLKIQKLMQHLFSIVRYGQLQGTELLTGINSDKRIQSNLVLEGHIITVTGTLCYTVITKSTLNYLKTTLDQVN